MVVLFPAPLGPSSPTISPRRTENEMSFTAVVRPYRLTRFSTSMVSSFDSTGKKETGEKGKGKGKKGIAVMKSKYVLYVGLLISG